MGPIRSLSKKSLSCPISGRVHLPGWPQRWCFTSPSAPCWGGSTENCCRMYLARGWRTPDSRPNVPVPQRIRCQTSSPFLSRWAWLTCLLAQQYGQHSGVTDIASKPLSPEDAELKYRFRDIHGGERRIDALVEMEGSVALHNEKGCLIQYGGFSPKGGSTPTYGGDDFAMPKRYA